MAQKHPQQKEELKELRPKIEEMLELKGTSLFAIREIANELGIDAGLVRKQKDRFIIKKASEQKENNNASSEENINNSKENNEEEEEIKEEDITIDEGDKKVKKQRNYLSAQAEIEICNCIVNGELKVKELAEMYWVDTSTIYRCLRKHGVSTNKKESNMKRKKKKKKRNRTAVKQQKPNTTVAVEQQKKEEVFVTIKFRTSFPIFEEVKDDMKVIWAISRNESRDDLRNDLIINTIDEMVLINDLRDRYNLISISGNIIHVIDFWNSSEKKIELFSQKTPLLFKKEDGTILSFNEFDEALKDIRELDKDSKRSRLKLGEFCFDPNNFTGLHKILGINKFSFNIVSKNNAKTVEAGLVADRHDGMPVDKFIYDASFDENLMFDYPEQERIAKKFLQDNFDFENEEEVKQLKLYVTGIQCAYGAVMKACIDMHVNLVTMHYNAKTKAYIPQYINGNAEDAGGYIKAFDKIKQQKSLNSEILLFNCSFEDFAESNVESFYIMEAAKMINTTSNNNDKVESVIIIIKDMEDIWKLYPTILKHIMANNGLNLALWVTSANIKNNTLYWGMNVIKSFNYK